MTDIINSNPTDILEKFREAYLNQIKKPMMIGSEEYILSSVFTYALSHYASLINQSYKNQLLESASGEFLDNIAKKYGLTRTPDVYSNAWFEGFFVINLDGAIYNDLMHDDHIYEPGELSINISGYTFTNSKTVNVNPTPVGNEGGLSPFTCRFVCEQPTVPFETSQFRELYLTATDSEGNLAFDVQRTSMYSKFVILTQATYKLNDDEFRKYIEENKYKYCPGVASAYEAIAKTCSPYIVDARCRTQFDEGFIPGNVDLFIKPRFFKTQPLYALINGLILRQDISVVEEACTSTNIITIGQILNIDMARLEYDRRFYTFYIAPEYDTDAYKHLYRLKFNAALGWLNNHMKIGETYIASMVVQIIKQDLSTLSTNLLDFGINDENSEAYIEFNKYCALPLYGTAIANGQVVTSTNNPSAHYVDATQYVYLPVPTDEQMDIPPAPLDPTANPKQYPYNYANFISLKGLE